MATVTTTSEDDTKKLAADVLTTLAQEKGTRATATIIALQGNLGAGKTVFTKGAAAHLGVAEEVTSPTFVIEKIYPLPEDAHWKRLVHVDAYRLEGEEELRAIDWANIATDPGNLIVVEWPEQVGLGIPERAHWLTFSVEDEETRNIEVPDTLIQNDA
jgi:tRNA threonylcarbamoyladenosine biosynthesis protein TsaE